MLFHRLLSLSFSRILSFRVARRQTGSGQEGEPFPGGGGASWLHNLFKGGGKSADSGVCPGTRRRRRRLPSATQLQRRLLLVVAVVV